MDKRLTGKFNLFVSGIASRMEENKEYFKDITLSAKSGTKIFTAKVTYENNEFYFDFQGAKEKIASTELAGIIEKTLRNYESADLCYSERGAKIIIECDGKTVKMHHADTVSEAAEQSTSAVVSGREYVVNPSLASELLKEIGIMAKNGKIKNDKIRKYNQIDYFTELMKPIIDKIPEDKEILITDCACGKSYLSFVMNFYLREILKRKCRFVGIDYSQTVIDASKKIAKKLGYSNMEFIKEDLTVYTPSEEPDIVISLHACDTATDMAMALGIRAKAKAIVCVPCCHKDILKQYSYEPFRAVTKYGILKARLADTLTDALRGAYLTGKGYDVTMNEYISPLETPKNIMIKAIKKNNGNENLMREYTELKALINVSPAIEKYTEQKNMYC